MHFEDFHVQLGIEGDRYSARVARSPAGEGTSWFEAPFQIEDLTSFRTNLRQYAWSCRLQGSPTAWRRAFALPDKKQVHLTARLLGRELFEALFQGEVRSLFDTSLGKVQDTGVLRLRLQFDVRRQELARLQELPWEFLCTPSRSDFLGLALQISIVRHLEVPRGVEALPQPLPLRILAAASNPIGLPALDLDREIKHLREAWRKRPEVEIVLLERASLEAIHNALVSQPFHVLHFMGHGALDERDQEGVLIFEESDGRARPIGGGDLRHLVQGFRSLRLAVLNACVTARAPSGSGLDPFAGVATALVQGGLPAVIAMQFPLSDEAAVAFSRSFYRRLAAGDPVETALAHGRLAIHASDPGSIEWATPVLFLRSASSRLFEPSDKHPPRPAAGATSSRSTRSEGPPPWWGSWGKAPGGRLFPIRGAGIFFNFSIAVSLSGLIVLLLDSLRTTFPASRDVYVLANAAIFGGIFWLLGKHWRFGYIGYGCGALWGEIAFLPFNMEAKFAIACTATPLCVFAWNLGLTVILWTERIALALIRKGRILKQRASGGRP